MVIWQFISSLIKNGPHNILAARVGGQMERRQLRLVGQLWNERRLRPRGLRRPCAGWNMLEQLAGNLLLAIVWRNVQGRHPNLGAGIAQAHTRLGKHVKDIRVAALGGQVDGGKAELVLVAGRHAVVQHETDSLEVAAFSGQVQRGVFVEAILGGGHEGLVNLKHGPQHLHGALFGGHVGQRVAVPVRVGGQIVFY